MNLSGTIEHFAETVTVRRPGAVTYVDGFATNAVETTRTVRMVVQPLDFAEAQQLPQGVATGGGIVGWSAAEIFGPTSTRGADVIEYDGADWEVVTVEPRLPLGQFWKIVAVRRGQHAT